MKAILTILLFFIFVDGARAQKDSLLLIRSYRGDIAAAAMDHLENLYIISSKGQVKKFNAAGDSAGVYNQVKNYGQLFSIDVSNPLKLLLFYKDFSTVVVLDRFLANVAVIDLRRHGILQPGAVGLSYDNNIWVFDEYDNRLKRINEQGDRLLETTDLRSIFSEGLSPQKILSDNGLVYLADSARGIFVFDNYGAYKKQIPLRNWKSISIHDNEVITVHGEQMAVYNIRTLTEKKGRVPHFQPYFQSFSSGNKFISFSPTVLQIYRLAF